MSLAYADEAIHIRQLAPLTARDIARATGAGQSTVEAWLARTRAPSGTRAERLLELAAIVEQAARVLRPEAIPVWLNKPVPVARAGQADRADRPRRVPARRRRARRARDGDLQLTAR